MEYNLGQVTIVNKGSWDAATTYLPLNMVSQSGGVFLCIATNSNIKPGADSTATNWTNYWVSMANGVARIDVRALDTSTAQMNITLSDGTVISSGTFSPAVVADGAVTHAKLASNAVETDNILNGAVTGAKLSGVVPANVGIKMGTEKPTYGTGANQITNGQIYLRYA